MMSKNAKETYLKIDFGSGYNPSPGFSTCDFTGNPMLDFQTKDYKIFCDKSKEIDEESVDEFHARNVIHHIEDLSRLFRMFYRYLKPGGRLVIVDCKEEFFSQNVFLDKLWYRYIIPRKEVWFSDHYRDYIKIAKENGFNLDEHTEDNEKETVCFLK